MIGMTKQVYVSVHVAGSSGGGTVLIDMPSYLGGIVPLVSVVANDEFNRLRCSWNIGACSDTTSCPVDGHRVNKLLQISVILAR